MATKKMNPAIEKREEKLHRDLDHDGEKGEPRAHQKKVLGYSKEQQLKKAAPKEKPAKKAKK